MVFYPPSPCLWQMPLAKRNYCGCICVHEDNSMTIGISGMWTNPLFLFILYFAHFILPTNIDMFCYNLSELHGPKEFAQPCLLAFSCDFSHLSKVSIKQFFQALISRRHPSLSFTFQFTKLSSIFYNLSEY